MAAIDVTDIIGDPDLSEPADGTLQYVRQVQTISNGGIAVDDPAAQTSAVTVGGLPVLDNGVAVTVTSTAPVDFSGVVCADGKDLTRSPESEEVYQNLTIHTATRLTDGRSPDTPADIVIWRGNRYTVVNVNDYSNFGQGFVMAECELISVEGGV